MHQLTQYVYQYGLSGVLEELMIICNDKAKETEDKSVKKKYDKAATKLYQLSKAKFIKAL